MDVLVSPQIFLLYFKNKLKPEKNEIDKIIEFIIDNPLNKIVISKRLVDFIDSCFEDGQNIKEYTRNYLTYLIDRRSINPKSSESIVKDEQIFNSLFLGYQFMSFNLKRDFLFSFRLKDELSDNINDCVLEEYKKPNCHWLGLNIAAFCPRATTLRYFDFNSDSEIVELIRFFIARCNGKPIIEIFDRNVNLEHELFAPFSQTFKVHYYTSRGNSLANSEKLKELRREIKNLLMFVADKSVIHERRIIIGNLIIEFDDDFWDISIDKNTWKIDMTYCSETTNKIKQKINSFQVVK